MTARLSIRVVEGVLVALATSGVVSVLTFWREPALERLGFAPEPSPSPPSPSPSPPSPSPTPKPTASPTRGPKTPDYAGSWTFVAALGDTRHGALTIHADGTAVWSFGVAGRPTLTCRGRVGSRRLVGTPSPAPLASSASEEPEPADGTPTPSAEVIAPRIPFPRVELPPLSRGIDAETAVRLCGWDGAALRDPFAVTVDRLRHPHELHLTNERGTLRWRAA